MIKPEIVKNIAILKLLLNIGDKDLVVGAGSALVMYNLRDSTSDIDIAVDHDIWLKCIDKLKIPPYYNKEFNVNIIEAKFIDADIHLDPIMMKLESRVIEGVNCLSPKELLKQKKAMNREKDQKDIANLEEYIAKHGG